MAKSRGERIKELLDERDMTARELAKRTGLTEVSVSRYISGERIPRCDTLAKIAEVLGTTADYLENGMPEQKSESEVVTVAEQRAHINMIRMLAGKLANLEENYTLYDGRVMCMLTHEEMDTIQRALACHWSVISLDMKNRKSRERRALDEIKQTGSESQGKDNPGEPSE